MKLTKIVATIGPACETEAQIKDLILAGVNVFRFNFKHNEVAWHESMIGRVNEVAHSLNRSVGTLLDLQGPEIRLVLPVPEYQIEEGEELCLVGSLSEPHDYKGKVFSVTHPSIIAHLNPGQIVKADDGEFEFEVVKKKHHTCLKATTAGLLKTRKTLNLPGADLPIPSLVESDLEGVKLAKRKEVDYVALSFVRTSADLADLRQALKDLQVNAQIVSKIETQKALDNLDEIIANSDGIMVARGDLGVELPIEQVPYHQKNMITKALQHGKFVITATQMLQSMIESSHPTRAEVSDVANAAFDLTDATMLSGETANGKYPLPAVKTMAQTLVYNETKFWVDVRSKLSLVAKGLDSMLAMAAFDLYKAIYQAKQPVKAFVVFSYTGKTARFLSSLRPQLPIIALCPTQHVADSLTVDFAVYPVVAEWLGSKTSVVDLDTILNSLSQLAELGHLEAGDQVVVTHGRNWQPDAVTTSVSLYNVPTLK